MANDCCSLRIVGGEDVTINQGEGINLAAGVYAYDADGESVPLYISPSEIDKCEVGEHLITYTARGKDNQMLPSLLCGENEVSIPDLCGDLSTVTKKRIVTIEQANPPVIRYDMPILLEPGDTFDPLENVYARDDNGNRIDVIDYEGWLYDIASGDIASFDTDLNGRLHSLKVFLDPVQDLHGYDAPWVGGAGKNKLNLDTTGIVPTQASYSDGVISIVDKAFTSNTSYRIGTFTVTQTTNYIFSGSVGGSTSTYQLRVYNNDGTSVLARSINGDSDAFSLTAGTTYAVYAFMYGGYTASGLKFKPMLRLSTVSDSTWQPYSNICPITGHDKVDGMHTGKNLNPNTGVNYTLATSIPFFLKAGQYVFSTDNGAVVSQNSAIYIQLLDEDGNNITDGGITSQWFVLNGARTVYYGGVNAPSRAFTLNYDAYFVIGFNNQIPSNFSALQLEVGSTATAYEPYSAESFHQDIEKTYTPTVQENEAYLFKQTGDVGGDRETIELVGGTVAWNQLAPSSDTYSNNNCTHSWNDEVITVTPSNYTNNACGVYKSGALIVGHKYFMTADFYLDYQGKTRVGCAVTATGSVRDKTIPANTWTTNNGIILCPSGGTTCIFYVRLQESGWTSGTYKTKNRQIIDLTQMFGSTIADYIYSLEQANAGAGVAWFKKLFPKPYYEYNAGELISVKTSSHDTVGFNALDSENNLKQASTNAVQTQNNIRVVGGLPYEVCFENTFSYGQLSLFEYDDNGTQITRTNKYGSGNLSATLNTKTTQVMLEFYRGTGLTIAEIQDANTCFHIATDAEKNGTYEPYVENTYPLDSDLELRGMLKLDASNNLYYDGDKYASDGTVTRKYGIVDLGTLNWGQGTSTVGTWFMSDVIQGIKPNFSASTLANALCSKYDQYSFVTLDSLAKGFCVIWSASSAAGRVYFKDSAYSTAADFKVAMSGVYLVYELATATTETAEAFEEIQKVTPIYGTEEFVDSRTVPMPVYTKTQYLTRDVYGGYIDLVDCKLVLDRAVTVFDGSSDEDWVVYGGGQFVYCRDLRSKAKRGTSVLAPSGLTSNMFVPKTSSSITSNYIMIDNDGDLRVNTDAFNMTSITDTRAWLSDNLLQVCYELAEPLVYDIPCHEIDAFIGDNNIWSEDGRVEVIFAKSIPQGEPYEYPVEGTYEIWYHVEDECGNEISQERTIWVGEPVQPE